MEGDLSLVGYDDHCLMKNPLDRLSDRDIFTFALVAIKQTAFPRVDIVGLKRSEDVHSITERRLMRRGTLSDDQDTMKWNLKPKVTTEDRDDNSVGYGKIDMRRHGNVYLIKVQVNMEWCELSFEGDPSIAYHLAFGVDKGSIMLMGESDLSIYLVSGVVLEDRPSCAICHLSVSEVEVFSCGHNTCADCVVKVYRTCKECPICKKDWKGGRDKTERGFIYDSFCRLDQCMRFTVLNLPCRCITCNKDTEKCTRCLKTIDSYIPFFKN